jgi:propanediol dehydratase small subunit
MNVLRYPLSRNMPQSSIKSKTGKSLEDISIENILSGNINSEDIKISRETLLMQGEIAEKEGRKQVKENFTRASELVDISDKKLLEVYEKLRPNRSTKEELMVIAKELEVKYGATECAKLIYETIQVYEKRGLFRV